MIYLALLSLLAPPAAIGETSGAEGQLYVQGGLTAEETARRAEATSFEVEARRADLEAAAAAVDQALLGYVPRLSGTARYVRLSSIETPIAGNIVAAPSVSGAGPIPAGAQLVNVPLSFPVILNQTTLQASLALPISDYLLRTSKAYASASNSRSAAELTERATRKKVATDARLLFYGWVRAKYQLLVAAQALEQARQHQADVNAAVDVGAASKADALRVDSQLAAAELLLERTRNFAELFEHQLRILLHDRDEAGYSIGEDLKAPAPAPEGVAQKGADGRAALIGEAIDRRLELKALDQSAKALDDLASFNRAGYFPRLDLFADVFEANPNPRIFPQREEFAATWQVGAQLSIALNDVLTARPSVSNAEARAASVRAQRALLADGLKTEVVQAHQAFGEASFAVETTKRGLTAAEESYRVRRALFQNGRATSLELTDAETDLTRARLEEINARVDLRVAIARIVHATGRDLEP